MRVVFALALMASPAAADQNFSEDVQFLDRCYTVMNDTFCDILAAPDARLMCVAYDGEGVAIATGAGSGGTGKAMFPRLGREDISDVKCRPN